MDRLVNKDLLTYLQDLPVVVLTSLYHYSATCLAVFRLVAGSLVRDWECAAIAVRISIDAHHV